MKYPTKNRSLPEKRWVYSLVSKKRNSGLIRTVSGIEKYLKGENAQKRWNLTPKNLGKKYSEMAEYKKPKRKKEKRKPIPKTENRTGPLIRRPLK